MEIEKQIGIEQMTGIENRIDLFIQVFFFTFYVTFKSDLRFKGNYHSDLRDYISDTTRSFRRMHA